MAAVSDILQAIAAGLQPDPASYIAGYAAGRAGDTRMPGAGLDAYSFYLGRADARFGNPARFDVPRSAAA